MKCQLAIHCQTVRVLASTLGLLASVAAQGILTPSGEPDPSHAQIWAWFDAAQGVNGSPTAVADGTAVSRWHDRSHNARHLTSVDSSLSRQARVRSSLTSCGTSVAFDGDDYIWGSASRIGRLVGARTIFVVTTVDSANRGYVFDGSTGSGRSTLHTGENANPGKWHAYFGDSTQPSPNGHLVVGSPVITGTQQVHALVIAPGRQEHHIDGVLVASASHPKVFNLGGLVLGARINLALGFDGQIKEVLLYSGTLSVVDQQAITGYLATRHPRTTTVPAPTPVDVFVSGDGRYPRYRIPGIIRSTSGTLLAFIEGRQGGDQSQNDIVLRRSFDGGKTWGPHQLMHDDGANALNNPVPVQIVRGPNAGRILLMYQRYPKGTTIWNALPGFSGTNIVSTFIQYSDNDGQTWSVPQNITRFVKAPSVAKAVNCGPGNAIQLRHGPWAGRIVFPFNRYDIDSTWGNYAVYSDDGGATWMRSADVPRDPALRQGNECQMVERADGSILMNARRSKGAKNRKVSTSIDGGLTWSTLADDPGLRSPGCMASVLRFTDPASGQKSRILYAGPDSSSSRVNGTVHVSFDEGKTWSYKRLAMAGGYAYSSLTPVDDRRFGLLYESTGNARISFLAMSVEWLSRGADLLGNGMHGGAYGQGCGGAGGFVPRLQLAGAPTPGACIQLRVDQVPGGAPIALSFGLSQTRIPFGPCTSLVGTLIAVSALGSAQGSGPGQGLADMTLQVPGSAQLFGLNVQALVLDPNAPLGFSASNGYELIVF